MREFGIAIFNGPELWLLEEICIDLDDETYSRLVMFLKEMEIQAKEMNDAHHNWMKFHREELERITLTPEEF